MKSMIMGWVPRAKNVPALPNWRTAWFTGMLPHITQALPIPFKLPRKASKGYCKLPCSSCFVLEQLTSTTVGVYAMHSNKVREILPSLPSSKIARWSFHGVKSKDLKRVVCARRPTNISSSDRVDKGQSRIFPAVKFFISSIQTVTVSIQLSWSLYTISAFSW